MQTLSRLADLPAPPIKDRKMQINLDDVLTPSQRKEIGAELTKKYLEAIRAIKVTPVKLDITPFITAEINEIFNDGSISDAVDFPMIGKKLTEKILKEI